MSHLTRLLSVCLLLTVLFAVSTPVQGQAGTFISANAGLPTNWASVRCSFKWKGVLYVSFAGQYQSFGSGTYRYDPTASRWQQVTEFSRDGDLCPVCSVQNNICYDVRHRSDYAVVSFRPDELVYNATSRLTSGFTFYAPPSNISIFRSSSATTRSRVYLREGGDALQGLDDLLWSVVEVNQILAFNVTTKRYVALSDPRISEARGGGLYATTLPDKSMVFTTSFMRNVWRYSWTLGKFHNITYDLDHRNMLYVCCGPVHHLQTNEAGETYMSTEQGVFRFLNNSWTRLISNWGNTYFTTGGKNLLFAKGAIWRSPETISGFDVSFFPNWLNDPVAASGPKWYGPYTVDEQTWFVLPYYQDDYFNVSLSADKDSYLVADRGNKLHKGMFRFTLPTATNNNQLYVRASQSNNFNVHQATYLGSAADDEAVDVKLAVYQGKKVAVVAINSPVLPRGVNANSVSDIAWGNSTSNGYLLIISAAAADRGTILAGFRCGNTILSLTSNIVTNALSVTTRQGLILIPSDWNVANIRTIAVPSPSYIFYKSAVHGSNSIVTVLGYIRNNSSSYSNHVNVYDIATGQLLQRRDVTVFAGEKYGGVADIAFHADLDLVYTVGFTQVAVGASTGLQRANLFAYNLADLSLNYSVFSHYTLSQLQNAQLMADTRLHQIELGRDGSLWILGNSAGGNSIFAFGDGKLLTGKMPLIIDGDNTHAFNVKSPHLLWYAKLAPLDGKIINAQWRFPRGSNGIGNTFNSDRARISVSASGEVQVIGVSACCLPGRDGSASNQNTVLRVNCRKVGRYQGDTVVVGVKPGLRKLRYWTTFTSDEFGGSGVSDDAAGVDADDEVGVALWKTTANSSALVITDGTNKAQSVDGYLVMWPINQEQDPAQCINQYKADLPVTASMSFDASYTTFLAANPGSDQFTDVDDTLDLSSTGADSNGNSQSSTAGGSPQTNAAVTRFTQSAWGYVITTIMALVSIRQLFA